MCYEPRNELTEDYLTSEINRMSSSLSDPDWYDNGFWVDTDNAKSDLKKVITFYKDIIQLRKYFADRGIDVLLNDIWNLFVQIRAEYLSKRKSRIDLIFEGIKPNISNTKSLHEIIKEFAAHYFSGRDYSEQEEKVFTVYSVFTLPALLKKFGFEYHQDHFSGELSDILHDVLREIRLDAFEQNITSSYEGIFSSSNHTRSTSNTSRDSISSDTKRDVWRRDEGRCVKCGSRNNLEYDHIIPVSKGGSNTARNIELLCQDCNRKKSDKIV
jgi:hypothetical protein